MSKRRRAFMFTVRCTKSLLKRTKTPVDPLPAPPTTKLGDWYANIYFTKPKHLVLCISERTLLPVVLVASDAEPLGGRLRVAVMTALRQLGVPEEAVQAEEAAMADTVIGPTASKRVLGVLNDFGKFVYAFSEPPGLPLDEMERRIAKIPCRTLGWKYPRDATLELFST